jgi:hypothetical protein
MLVHDGTAGFDTVTVPETPVAGAAVTMAISETIGPAAAIRTIG